MIDNQKIKEARGRGGGPAEDRDKDVEDFLSELGDPVAQYDGPSDRWDPDAHSEYVRIAENPAVSSVEGWAEIVGVSAKKASTLLTAHGIARKTIRETAEEQEADAIELPGFEVEPEYLESPWWQDARFLHHAFVRLGLGYKEISRVASDVNQRLKPDAQPSTTEVSGEDIKNALRAVGLIAGEPDDNGRNEYGISGRFDVTQMHAEEAEEKGLSGGMDINVSKL